MTNALSLRLALGANALFSITCAVFMLFRPSLVGAWLGVNSPLVLQGIGLGLLVFAADLLHQATRPRIATWRALYASAADFLWVIGTIILLGLFPQVFSPFGTGLALAVAAGVLFFGIWQLWGIKNAHRGSDTGEYRHCILVDTNAPADAMWRVVSELGDIDNYMPSLKKSEVLAGQTPGVGAIRTCENHAGKRWAEECTAFNPGRSFTVRFVSEDPDFPFPAKTMYGGWEVKPINEGSQVMVWWELTPKQRVLAPIVLPVLAFQVDRDFPRIIQRMAVEAIGSAQDVLDRQGASTTARLLPSPC